MGRVSNRHLLEAIEELTEAVTLPTYTDPHAPVLTLDKGEYYGTEDVLEQAALCYKLYHFNPLFRRAVDLKTSYVWGRGITMMSPQPEVDRVIRDLLDRNRRELGHQGRTEKDKTLTLEGNLFLVLDTDALGAVTVRQVPMNEITESRRDPADYRNVWYWKRTYTTFEPDETGAYGQGAETSVYHPALDHDPPGAERPAEIDGIPVLWNAPLLHIPVTRIGREVFAMPEFTTACPWATSYSHFLSQISSIASSLARFAMRATAKTADGAKKVEKILDTGTGEVTKPGGKTAVGSVFVSTEGVTLEPIRTAGVVTNADEGRRFALMVASGTHTPEHMLMGDPSTGNLATTRMMERPYELSILDRQLLWADAIEAILTYGVKARVMAAEFTPLTGTVEEDEFGRKLVLVDVTDPDDDVDTGEDPVGPKEREEAKIIVTFPAVLEHDVATEISAIVDMATLKGQKLAGMVDRATLRRLLLEALNIPDVDEMIANMDRDELAEQSEPGPVPPVLAAPAEPEDEEDPAEEQLTSAVQLLRTIYSSAIAEASA